ncbi:MAG: hypothetical protein HQK57_08555 [Deltaproteobacteria bacterium]|nr:hypothetical protein [Deltaproteobacteria bacterium]
MKKALVIRYGAIGDHIMASTLLPYLKADGFQVYYQYTMDGKNILRGNPHVDVFLKHDESIPHPDLPHYWDGLGSGYDRVVNLSESIERRLLLFHQDRERYELPLAERQALGQKNYYEETVRCGGYEPVGPVRGELFFSPAQTAWARSFMRRLRGTRVILWILSGSAVHKAYPHAEQVGLDTLARHKNVVIVTVGDELCRLLEWNHPRTINKAGRWPLWKSLIMSRYAHLVIGGETGVMNAAGCFDTPKICLLSHSSKENLTKHWVNDFSIPSPAACSPCHRMIYDASAQCPKRHPVTRATPCMDQIGPKMVVETIDRVLSDYREGRLE